MKFKEEIIASIIKKNWLNTYTFDLIDNPLNCIIDSIKKLESKNIFSNEIIIFFQTKEHIPLYVTNSIEPILGYTQEEFIAWGKDALLNIGAFAKTEFWEKLQIWMKEFLELEPIPHKEIFKFRSCLAGVEYNHKEGGKKNFLLKVIYPIGENKAMPNYHFIQLEDIGHFLKEDSYWAYYEKFNEKEKTTRLYTKDGYRKHMITNREQEILNCISLGMNSKEVAKELYISTETVNRHRKNMINRLGTKDISSLIQICKLCEVI